MLLTQEQVEERMYLDGREKMLDMMRAAEEGGRASTAPYASRVFRDFVLDLSQVLQAALADYSPGKSRAAITLLQPLDPDAVAFLSVRHVLNACLQADQNQRALGYSLGRAVHRELVLAQFENEAPELYHTLARDFQRRMSKDERHRLTVFKLQAKERGIELNEWGLGNRDQVGLWLLDQLMDLGMIEMGPMMTKSNGYKREYRPVDLSAEVRGLITQIKGYVAETRPTCGPCVEPPRDWATLIDGGWHTPRMRRAHWHLVKCHPSVRPLLRKHEGEMAGVFEAVNHLQRTAWRINPRVLDAVLALADAKITIAEVEAQVETPKPARAAWMDLVEKDQMTEAQAAELQAWKREARDWYEARAVSARRFGRFYTATRQAIEFRNYPALYFVYFADSRGRLYPMTYGVNPQGSDLQKALLTFAEGLPLDTPGALRWFMVHGANKFGFDSASLDEREQWVRDNAPMILACAQDPVANRAWATADCPLQFLAWCFEFADRMRDPAGFRSYLPISMDGSCNGLQHFSAMLRDEVGGEATNLRALPQRQDIYMRVAKRAEERLRAAPPADPVVERWQHFGVARALVKRAVMTTPYGVTQRSATDYVITDYLARGEGPDFDRTEYRAAAAAVIKFVWPAIGDIVVKARAAMDWLKKAGSQLSKEVATMEDPAIHWRTPSGFLATQAYFDRKEHVIRTRLVGLARVKVVAETDDPDGHRHALGLAPNFVHSMDAAHLHLVTLAAKRAGISALAMIHDDYGTHAANADRLFHIIREEFVAMYQTHDPLQELATKYPKLPAPPGKGALDLQEVLSSEFFFS